MKNVSRDEFAASQIMVATKMIQLFCRRKHSSDSGLCPSCTDLLAYVAARSRNCPRWMEKTSCRRCPIHCYSPLYREKIREVMRFSGPRMLMHHPLWVISHWIKELSE